MFADINAPDANVGAEGVLDAAVLESGMVKSEFAVFKTVDMKQGHFWFVCLWKKNEEGFYYGFWIIANQRFFLERPNNENFENIRLQEDQVGKRFKLQV